MIEMDFLILFLFSLLTKCSSYDYDIFFFKQKVDHFTYTNTDFFLQRYFINSKYFNPKNGTIFFYTGNEGYIEMFANNTGFMWENAALFNALIVFAEHRYYGLSLPYGNESYKDNKHLGYLTTEQALADFADLIAYIKQSTPGAKDAPVVVFGGSYGGMLAAWIRMKYPHLVDGAVASSAPILQFDGLVDCAKFSEIVTKDFSMVDNQCALSIKKSWKVIRSFAASGAGLKFLTMAFKLCEFLVPSKVDDLINWLSSTWSYLAMTDYPYATKFLHPLPAYPIAETCKYLTDSNVSSKELITNIYKAASVFQNYTGDVLCYNLTTSGGSYLGEKGWDYQACTEMVMPVCQNGVTDMFEPVPWNFSSYSDSCWQKWKVKPDLKKAVIIYGGKNITASSNIIFSNGKLDPWYSGGVLKSLSDTLIAIQIENAAHHLDLRASNPSDPPSVKKARRIILSWIAKWISRVKM